jgi:hypothetical protein
LHSSNPGPCIELLLQHGAQDENDQALLYSAQLGQEQAVMALLEAAQQSVSKEASHNAEQTALCGAANTGQSALVRALTQ